MKPPDPDSPSPAFSATLSGHSSHSQPNLLTSLFPDDLKSYLSELWRFSVRLIAFSIVFSLLAGIAYLLHWVLLLTFGTVDEEWLKKITKWLDMFTLLGFAILIVIHVVQSILWFGFRLVGEIVESVDNFRTSSRNSKHD